MSDKGFMKVYDTVVLDEVNSCLRDCLRDTIKALAVRTHEKGLELAYHTNADVPDKLVGDPDRLRQVIVNLPSGRYGRLCLQADRCPRPLQDYREPDPNWQ